MWRTFVTIELPVGTYLKSLAPAMRGCLVMAAAVTAVRWITPASLPPALQFTITVLTGSVAYAALLGLAERPRLREFYAVLRSIRR
jgi:hypothetical protein